MNDSFYKCAAGAALAALMAAATGPARAEINDYEFQLSETTVEQRDDAVIVLKLIDKRSAKLIPDAVIFATRLDMAPDGMPTMTARIEQLPSDAPGLYRFKTDLVMQGNWQLSLAAKVQGEEGTLKSQLVFEATP